MSKLAKLAGVAGIATLLTACGGGGDDKPQNVPDKTIYPNQLSSEFVPFQKPSFLSDLLGTNDNLNEIDSKYNKALSQAIGEMFGDQLILRSDAKLVEIFDQGVSLAKYRNITCTTETKLDANTVQVTPTNPGSYCPNAGVNKFKSGSISLTEKDNIKTLKFNNALYNPLDFKDKDDYLVNGEITLRGETSGDYSYEINKAFSYQILDSETLESKEYLGLSDYIYSVIRTDKKILTTQGNIIGQPYGEDFSYNFNFYTSTPFVFEKIIFSDQPYPQASGQLTIFDRFYQRIDITQTKDKSNTAMVSFNQKQPIEMKWIEITGK